MKAGRGIISISILAALIMTGCAGKSTQQIKNENTLNVPSVELPSEDGDEAIKLEIGMYGKVKKVIGNSVTIALAEKPKPIERKDQAGAGKTSTGNDGQSLNQPPAGGEGPPPNMAQGGPPGSGTGNNLGHSTGSGSRNMTFGLQMSNLKLTGEVIEIMIPVGVSLQSTAGKSGQSIDFADIEVGDIITIFYLQGTEQIQRVNISASSSSN